MSTKSMRGSHGRASHAPGRRGPGGAPEGPRNFTGLLRKEEGGWGVPLHLGRTPVLIRLREGPNGATEGDVVAVEVRGRIPRGGPAWGKVVKVLGRPGTAATEVAEIGFRHGLPLVFSPAALREAEGVARPVDRDALRGRVDLRSVFTMTIDGERARDFDDAVAVERLGPDSLRLWVSIADVSHYVAPGGALDREAYERGTSVYFPDRAVPMLPEVLSNDVCSLRPGLDRLVQTVEMDFDPDGTVLRSSCYAAVIRSAHRLTYRRVSEILEGSEPREDPRLAESLATMRDLAGWLRARRRRRGSIDFDFPEIEIEVGEAGEPIAVTRAVRGIANQIIEEFMIAANECVAALLEREKVPVLYRIHEEPDAEKVGEFMELLHNLGLSFHAQPKGAAPAGRLWRGGVHPMAFQRVLDAAGGRPEERLVNTVMLRSMKQARYAPENRGHFGLAAPSYCHFTSPIRRYPDLVVHRGLRRLLEGHGGNPPRELAEMGDTLSERERRAMEAEREMAALKKAQFMADKVGQSFGGFITGVSEFGCFVELERFQVEGLVHVSRMGEDFFRFHERGHALVGGKSKRRYRLGDRVEVRLEAAHPERRQLDFSLVVPAP